MDFLNFSYNWNNKLDCKAFTTIRLADPVKYQMNCQKQVQLINNKREVLKACGTAQLVYINTITLSQLTEPMAQIDTGYTKQQASKIIFNMYKNKVKDIENAKFFFMVWTYLK